MSHGHHEQHHDSHLPLQFAANAAMLTINNSNANLLIYNPPGLGVNLPPLPPHSAEPPPRRMTGGTAFAGHLLPGSFFIVFSLWWIVCALQRFKRCTQYGVAFRASASYQLTLSSKCNSLKDTKTQSKNCLVRFCRCFFCCCCILVTKLPVEGLVKLLAATVGTLGELATGWDYGRQRIRPSGTQHVTMYLLYGISGLADVLVYTQAYYVPQTFEYVGLAFAVGGEALLLYLHAPHDGGGHGGHNVVENSCHQLLFYCVAACFIAILFEVRMRHSLTITLTRAYALLLHGVWFVATGCIIAPPWSAYVLWDLDDAENSMYILAIFIWVAMGLVILVLLIAAQVLAPVRGQLAAAQRDKTNTTVMGYYRPIAQQNTEDDDEIYNSKAQDSRHLLAVHSSKA